jgi:hypothetical protein
MKNSAHSSLAASCRSKLQLEIDLDTTESVVCHMVCAVPSYGNRGSSVSIVSTCWTTGRSRFDHRQRQKDFSCSLCVQTSSGAHPASCPMGTGGPFPGGKARRGRDADHLTPSSAEVVNEKELYLLSLQTPSWRVAGLLYLVPPYIVPLSVRACTKRCLSLNICWRSWKAKA